MISLRRFQVCLGAQQGLGPPIRRDFSVASIYTIWVETADVWHLIHMLCLEELLDRSGVTSELDFPVPLEGVGQDETSCQLNERGKEAVYPSAFL